MSSYFDEHNCEPLGENERPNDDLHLARLLLDSGIASALNIDYGDIAGLGSSSSLVPPASKAWLETTLKPENRVDEETIAGKQCPICLREFQNGEKTAIKLPCEHLFHVECVERWLRQTSTCPSCRFELPTDDPFYEDFKKQKKRELIRKKELESLHDSMYT